jgi:hypothetical protein
MTADWYLLLAMLGPVAGLCLLVAAVPFLVYSFCARNPRRGRAASKVGFVLNVLAVLVSAVLWKQLLSGYYRYDAPVDYADPDFVVYEVIAALEALALLTSLLSAVRQRAHRSS